MKNTITVLGQGLCILLALWVLLAAPTGWIYDLWAGTGTGQGQTPDESVQYLQRQEEVETFFLSKAPVTVSGGELAACPLARLRDTDQAGTHTRNSGGVKRSVFVSEYITAGYPLSQGEKLLQGLAGGFYNRYYLLELADGTHLCVYFDDYLLLSGGEGYPTGYIRYTTTEERRMLDGMTGDYDVDTVHVLDMYRHGKVNWMLDIALRLGVLAAAAFVGLTLRDVVEKRRGKEKS